MENFGLSQTNSNRIRARKCPAANIIYIALYALCNRDLRLAFIVLPKCTFILPTLSANVVALPTPKIEFDQAKLNIKTLYKISIKRAVVKVEETASKAIPDQRWNDSLHHKYSCHFPILWDTVLNRQNISCRR